MNLFLCTSKKDVLICLILPQAAGVLNLKYCELKRTWKADNAAMIRFWKLIVTNWKGFQKRKLTQFLKSMKMYMSDSFRKLIIWQLAALMLDDCTIGFQYITSAEIGKYSLKTNIKYLRKKCKKT
jgi:hypothetical protein